MKKFTFKLETLLDIKKSNEEKIQIEMASALSQLQYIKDYLLRVINKQNYYKNEMELLKTNSQYIDDLIAHQTYTDSLQNQIDQIQLQILQQEEIIAEIRARLLQASKERQMIEKMKEKEKAAYMQKTRKEELKFLDEVGVIKEARRIMSML